MSGAAERVRGVCCLLGEQGWTDGITDATQRVNQRWVCAGIHLLPQTGNENFHRPRVVFVITLPHALAKFRPGKDTPRFLHENLQHIEFARRKGNGRTGACDSAVLHIHVQVGNFQEVGPGRAASTPSQRFHTRDELIHGKRFGEIIVGSSIQSFHPTLHFSARGEDENARETLCLPKPREHGETIQAGQIQVEDDEINRIGQSRLQTGRSIVLRGCAMAVPGQGPVNVPGKLQFIFNDKNLHRAGCWNISAQCQSFVISEWANSNSSVTKSALSGEIVPGECNRFVTKKISPRDGGPANLITLDRSKGRKKPVYFYMMLRSIALAAGVSVAHLACAQGPIPTPIANGTVTIELQTVASGLVAPELLISPPDGTDRQFIVDQPGRVLVRENGTLLATPFLDARARITPLSAGYDERGLLGLAFDPGFSNPASPGFRRIFTYTNEPITSGTPDFTDPYLTGAADSHSVVASWKVDPLNPDRVDPASRQELLRFEHPQANHNGGTINFGPDGFLYIGEGDGGGANDNPPGHNPTIGNGQDNSVLLGKILRIDPNGTNSANGKYGIPATNPFAADGGAKEIFATGFRNPYRMSFDGPTLLVADVGQNNIEELDAVEVGKNYGWRYKEGTFKFNPSDGSVSSNLSGVPPGLTDPIFQYDHDEGISIIGGFVYHGRLLPDLAGKYVFGDFSTSFNSPNGRLFYADLGTAEIRELMIGSNDRPLGFFVKGMGLDQNGELYVLASTALGPSGTTGVALLIVPEPSAGVLVGVGAALLCRRRRK